MGNIKFIGRHRELKMLEKLSSGNFFLIVRGRRRIGKTALIRRYFENSIYLFIWPDKSLDWILEQISVEYKLPRFKDFGSLLEYLFESKRTVLIDEFQSFLNVDKSVYGEIQKVIDNYRQKDKPYKLVARGSSYSLMNKVFYDSASPLYGRKTHEINLENIDILSLFNEMKISLSEFIEIWSAFEGVPYYYEFVDRKKSARENIIEIVLSRDSQLRDEGKAIFSIEFGKDARTYNTVLTAISEGKTKLNEISSLFNNKKNESIKYLDLLRKDFNMVRKTTPIIDKPLKSRLGQYEIIDNFLSFWFYFYDRNRPYVEQERFDEVADFFNKEFNSYVGRKFEKFILTLLRRKMIPELDFEKIGRQWGSKLGKSYEFDIVALNEKKNEIIYGECKWKEDVSALEVLNELVEKKKFASLNISARKERFILFAKSFEKKINEFEGYEVLCYDLKDIEKKLIS